jgi:hypothetical protein
MRAQADTAAFYQTLALMIGVAEFFLLLCVFLMPDTLGQHRMVSTNLFALFYYKLGTTLLIVLQLLVVMLYMWRFWTADPVQTTVTALFVCCALTGWILTVSCNPDTDHTNHAIGAGLFVGGTSAYYVEVLRLTYHFDPISRHRYDLAAAGVLGAAGVFAIVYVSLYFSSPDTAWLWENIAFILMAAGFVLFFWFHPFNPAEQIKPAKPQSVHCEPLLRVNYSPFFEATPM